MSIFLGWLAVLYGILSFCVLGKLYFVLFLWLIEVYPKELQHFKMRLVPFLFYKPTQVKPRISESPSHRSAVQGVHFHTMDMDSFQLFGAHTKTRLRLEEKYLEIIQQYEDEQNPHYQSALAWADTKPSKERRKHLNIEGGEGFTDYAIAAMLKKEMKPKPARQQTPLSISSESLSEGSDSTQSEDSNSTQDVIQVFPLPDDDSPSSNTLQQKYWNYVAFNPSSPQQRALPEGKLDTLHKNEKIANAIYEGKNALVYTVGTRGQQNYFHRNRILAFRWKLTTNDLVNKF